MNVEVEIVGMKAGVISEIKISDVVYDLIEHEITEIKEIPEPEKLTRKPNRGFPQRGSAYNRGRSRF